MKNPIAIIFVTVALDAIGIGLIFPILPGLLSQITNSGNIAVYMGFATAIYALMQFLFSPVLGALSDSIGRRPVLLISLLGAAVSYFIMATSTNFGMLLTGRAIAGLTSANMAVASAYITDISEEDKRAARFGIFNAMFGIGFIIGPVIGGILGDMWIRLPFVIAGVLNTCNLLVAIFLLPESCPGKQGKPDFSSLNPFLPIRSAIGARNLVPILLVFFLFSFSGEIYGTCWALWGVDTFQWDGFWVGLSLAAFGICQSLVQVFVTGFSVRHLGNRATIFLGLACACLAAIGMAWVSKSWAVFAIMPLFAMGGIGAPALQALATTQAAEQQQGQLQGVLASVMSLASIFGPLVFSSLYFLLQKQWPGAIWLTVLVVYMLIVPIVYQMKPAKILADS